MSDENQIPSELETLKARADQLGIEYRANIGVERLRTKINNKLEGTSDESEEPAEETKSAPVEVKEVKKEPVKRTKTGKPTQQRLSANQYKERLVETRQKDAAKLVRVRVSCMNPNKRGWEGEIISAGSAKLGTFKKYVKFDVIWHVPNIIYLEMKERKFTTFTTTRGPRGEQRREGKLVNEFSIELMPQLTEAERLDLAQRQAMAEGTTA